MPKVLTIGLHNALGHSVPRSPWWKGKHISQHNSIKVSFLIVQNIPPGISFSNRPHLYVLCREGSWIILNQSLYTKHLLTNFPSKRRVTQYRPEFIYGTFRWDLLGNFLSLGLWRCKTVSPDSWGWWCLGTGGRRIMGSRPTCAIQ